MMNYRQLSPDYAVMGQIQPGHVAGIAAAGFRSIICNRPDGEDPGQPSVAEIRAEAEKAGLAFRHLPVISGGMTQDDVVAQAAALRELEGPVFAYCRSGTRCANLYAGVRQLGE